MPALLSISSLRCHRDPVGVSEFAHRNTKSALHFGANRDVTPQAVIAPLIASGSMLGRMLALRHAIPNSDAFPAQYFFGDSKTRDTFGEGMT